MSVSLSLLCQYSGGSNGGLRVTRAPPGPNSFNFMQFWGKFGKIVCWRPPEGWRPHLGEILDLPLQYKRVLTCMGPS